MILFDDARSFVTKSDAYKNWSGLASVMPLVPTNEKRESWIKQYSNVVGWDRPLRKLTRLGFFEAFPCVTKDQVIDMFMRSEAESLIVPLLRTVSSRLWKCPDWIEGNPCFELEKFLADAESLNFDDLNSIADKFTDFSNSCENSSYLEFILVMRPEIFLELEKKSLIGQFNNTNVKCIADSNITERLIDGNDEKATFESTVYLIPFRWVSSNDSSPLLYFSYQDFRDVELPEDCFWTDDGKFLWRLSGEYWHWEYIVNLHWFVFPRPTNTAQMKVRYDVEKVKE